MVASRCNAINDRDSRFISKVLGRQEGSTGHADRYPEVLVLYLERPLVQATRWHDLGRGAADTAT
jgi:hypothetical protein